MVQTLKQGETSMQLDTAVYTIGALIASTLLVLTVQLHIHGLI